MSGKKENEDFFGTVSLKWFDVLIGEHCLSTCRYVMVWCWMLSWSPFVDIIALCVIGCGARRLRGLLKL